MLGWHSYPVCVCVCVMSCFLKQHERVLHTVSAQPLRVFRRALHVPSDRGVDVRGGFGSRWLTVAQCVLWPVWLRNMYFLCVCGGGLKGFSTVNEVSHHDMFSESSEQHISGIVSIIRRRTDTPAFHFSLCCLNRRDKSWLSDTTPCHLRRLLVLLHVLWILWNSEMKSCDSFWFRSCR